MASYDAARAADKPVDRKTQGDCGEGHCRGRKQGHAPTYLDARRSMRSGKVGRRAESSVQVRPHLASANGHRRRSSELERRASVTGLSLVAPRPLRHDGARMTRQSTTSVPPPPSLFRSAPPSALSHRYLGPRPPRLGAPLGSPRPSIVPLQCRMSYCGVLRRRRLRRKVERACPRDKSVSHPACSCVPAFSLLPGCSGRGLFCGGPHVGPVQGSWKGSGADRRVRLARCSVFAVGG